VTLININLDVSNKNKEKTKFLTDEQTISTRTIVERGNKEIDLYIYLYTRYAYIYCMKIFV